MFDQPDRLDKAVADLRQTADSITHLIDSYSFKVLEEARTMQRYPLETNSADYLKREDKNA